MGLGFARIRTPLTSYGAKNLTVYQTTKIWDDITPISSELFGPERFGMHALSLAEQQLVTLDEIDVYSVINRLADNAEVLLRVYRNICDTVARGKNVTPAAEWLMDNYHLVEQQIRQTRSDLPAGFYRQLPKLSDGPLSGQPRIFGTLWAYVAHTDSRFDEASLTNFINAYQAITPFTIGELWAGSISLRLVLIENLRRISERVDRARVDREAADAAADAILKEPETQGQSPSPVALPDQETVSIPFAVKLLQRLRDLDDERATTILGWLQRKVGDQGHTLDTVVADEHHRQAAANVTARNIVQSLRLVTDLNWESWFDEVSHVDKLLRTVPLYEAMDFQSRNLYRNAVEELARGSRFEELEIVHKVLANAADPANHMPDPGHWLLGNGRKPFEREIDFTPPPLKRIRDRILGAGLGGYLGCVTVLVILLELMAASAVFLNGWAGPVQIALVIAALIPASEIGFATVNLLYARLLETRVSPGLALRDGVPAHLRTLVAIPCLLYSGENVEELLERLEIHFLSSGAGELYYALVTDWTDSDQPSTATDVDLLNRAAAGIVALNQRHETDRFLLLHRQRSYDEKQKKWMGWERKRGKLHELNQVLRGALDTSFKTIIGTVPSDVRYVITLDADTRLPRDAARRLVGKMAHPLNGAVFDDKTMRVISGHGILQPRVTASLPTGTRGSYFQKVFSTTRGIDPYVFAASDIYEDLFGEGSFTGKGIYDIDAFQKATELRIPENAILSHDLFEGIFARAGLVSDVEVVEEYPERYEVSNARQHRWARGDWQLLPWILGLRKNTHVPPLGEWKMIDNLRRSLLPIVQLAILFAAWIFLPFQPAMLWTAAVAFSIFTPLLIVNLVDGFFVPQHSTLQLHLTHLRGNLKHAFVLGLAQCIFLTDQATLMADAIVRTLYRLTISKKNLLEWTTAAQAQMLAKPGMLRSFLLMINAPIIGVLLLAIIAYRGSGAWLGLAPVACAWMMAPAIAFWISRNEALEDELAASQADTQALRIIARRTYRYFEQFVTAADNHLPPDNMQEDPVQVVAHRTSPTNIGLYLLSTAAAHEFGWLSLAQTVDRIEATFATMTKLEMFRGHFYNWYDTQSLVPLEPKYVSSVDSGNLAGHLITVANCFEAWSIEPETVADRSFGIDDILEILADQTKALVTDLTKLRPLRKGLIQQIRILKSTLDKARLQPEVFGIRLVELSVQANKVANTAERLAAELTETPRQTLLHWSSVLRRTVESHFEDASLDVSNITKFKTRLHKLSQDARAFAYGMEFGFLFDPQRELLSIGYRINEGQRDESCYDMLASEARLASYFAIAKGDIKTRHWFKLGRTLTSLKSGPALVSWSGSMFEYLMPSLVMRAPSEGLLDQTSKRVVTRQMEYAKGFAVPWGISESAFYARDVNFTYQYLNFGVPGLGLKRGLASNLVIAPYATGLATMVVPSQAMRNYEALRKLGAQGQFGYYEALDYTRTRLKPGELYALVRAYFAHHQGMTIVAILNAVRSGVARDWFHQELSVRASELLLQERAPRDVVETVPTDVFSAVEAVDVPAALPRTANPLNGPAPTLHLLSNGSYSVMLTAAGSGYSLWKGLAITRWREDPVSDNWGQFIYLKEPRTGNWWSATHMPLASTAANSTAVFSEHRVEIMRNDGVWQSNLECIVSPESNAEARRLTLINRGLTVRDIELTSYTELVLAPAPADSAHPVFSKMFVTTEFVPGVDALIATRRKRAPSDADIWVAQVMVADGTQLSPLEYETDRSRFIGRGRDIQNPEALTSGQKLSNTVGTVLDPVFALRRRVRVPRGRQVQVTLWTMAAPTREALLDLVDQHRQVAAFDRGLMLAWTQGQIQLRHLSITSDEADLYQELASSIVYANAYFRPPATTLVRDMGAQTALWPQGISGDKPIVLFRIDNADDLEGARQILRAFEYWKSKRLLVDLVILNERMSSYVQDLQATLEGVMRKIKTAKPPELANQLGEVYLVRADLMAAETLRVLAASARVVIYARRGSIASQLARKRAAIEPGVADWEAVPRLIREVPGAKRPAADLQFFNGSGGFNAEGTEYVIYPTAAAPTAAPWTNVIANEQFGFHATSDGPGYSWYRNSKEMQLTPWNNDPVSNRPAEAFYVADLDTGSLLSPGLLPLRDADGTHTVRHGFGYTVYERQADHLKLELTQFVPVADAVKISRLRITNLGGQTRSLSVTAYAEWVLGPSRQATASFITSEIDAETKALIARNKWSPAFENQVAFLDMRGEQSRWTADRQEFVGRFGSLSHPLGLAMGHELSNRVGAGIDPCGALQVKITLSPGATREVAILLGAAADVAGARSLLTKYKTLDIEKTLQDVKQNWRGILGSVKVETADPAFNLMMNGWLLYQTLSCRTWGRSGFYQASGAYGFRDQLQDSLALMLAKPQLTRQHILRAAARQFHEGDVQHWWLPATGTGIRTKISDDVIWLAYCTAQYVSVTGDKTILDEMVPFIDGPQLESGHVDAFFQPTEFGEQATLYDHCVRALEQRMEVGAHGLPLMGSGDWNDGMNRVGEGGKGESIWLAWFMVATLKDFSKLSAARGDTKAEVWNEKIKALVEALENQAWDGNWYRRGFYDDGTPLGSAANAECKIDAIAQSWAAISGEARPERASQAMAEVEKHLIRTEDKIALLFTPPFDKSAQEPGYIKGYPPGLRENGGQYTHGTLWSIFAFSQLGQHEEAWNLFALINPVNHARTAAEVATYKVEPYVVAADVYSVEPHVGRGGWTWYTGAAGVMYRAGLQAILGFEKRGNTLRITNTMPPSWKGFQIAMEFDQARYEFTVTRAEKTSSSSKLAKALKDGAFEVSLNQEAGTYAIALSFAPALAPAEEDVDA